MDIRMKQFVKIILATSLVFLVLFLLLWTVYAYIPINFYKHLFSIITLILLGVVLFFILISFVLLIIFKNEKTFIVPPKFALIILRLIYPFILGMADFFHYDKNPINQFFIHMNNIFVDSMGLKGNSMDILILVPHCIQNSECNIKVTSNPTACKACGKCKIADLNIYNKKYGYQLAVATGGTLARRVVKEYRPKYIIAIACERDLISGILDINNIPVYGILNQCPNGPCLNTTVDVDKVMDAVRKYAINVEDVDIRKIKDVIL